MTTNDIAQGKNGEVYPCPECGRHETVRWLSGDSYRYHCDDCDVTYSKRSLDTDTYHSGGQR